ncbi:hypothetical protein GPECTOR_16g656 [Gonium pectorale]|uniref:Carbonic anhydrase n=1 Tax=Gonium pectorale TaxID=33097 RepID=A0A150GL11_GONPE|nr:hypothetical protein GPECTOR_16g656 [Gonium pectorale]|eukprot:KXZ50481.1 hypothetical protein GPECTOR_16g656 [Gonium pectorale]
MVPLLIRWEGVDGAGKPWVCKSGKRQSPLNLPSSKAISHIPRAHQTRWSYPNLVSNGSNIEIINNGHTIQVEWLSPYGAEVNITVPANATNETRITDVITLGATAKTAVVKAVPLQFHFHATSEHMVDGKIYPLELHIVHRVTDLPACASGCFTVTGVLFELTTAGPDNPLLEPILEHAPVREGDIHFLPAGEEIQLGELLPAPAERDYITYEGSLTTPPCSEGLLWHVLTTPQKISLNQWRKYRSAVSFKDCAATNGTSSTDSAEHGHHRHHHRRILAAEEATTTAGEEYTCKIVAYGANFRNVQKVYERPVKLARAQ